MKSVLLASAVMVLPLLAACPGLGCGAFSGGGDKVYQRTSESLILCENGGFVANTTTGSFEGRYMEDANGQWFATKGDDGQLAFDFSYAADGSLDAPQLGTTAWTLKTMDATALDHADVQCQDLETRAWWTAQ